MRRSRRITIVVVTGLLMVAASYVGERMTRRWRVPDYHVTLPGEFDVDEAIGGGKGSDTFLYSPRRMYLGYHRRGWEGAKIKWITGRWEGGMLAQVPLAGNQGLHDGWQQFQRQFGRSVN